MKYLKKYGISVEKKVHRGWEEHQKMSKNKAIVPILMAVNHPLGYFGKWQYIYTSKKGNISMVKLFDYHRVGEHIFEIYCLDDEKNPTPAKIKLPDTTRFINRLSAIKFITEVLR